MDCRSKSTTKQIKLLEDNVRGYVHNAHVAKDFLLLKKTQHHGKDY